MASVPGTTGASTSTHSGPQLKGAEDAGGQTLSRVRARPHQSQPQPQQPSQSQPQQSQPQIQPLPPFPPSAPPASRPNTFYPPLHHGEPIGAAQRASKIGSTPTFSTATVAAGPGAETATGTGTGSGKGVKRTQVFKRTRTGCTTCRRRKLKCDEGKPACARCVKSKAPCEYLDYFFRHHQNPTLNATNDPQGSFYKDTKTYTQEERDSFVPVHQSLHFNPPNEIRGPPGIRILNPVTTQPEQPQTYGSHDLQTLAATAAAAQYPAYPSHPSVEYPTYGQVEEHYKSVTPPVSTQATSNPNISSLLNPTTSSMIDPNLEAPARQGQGLGQTLQWVSENENQGQSQGQGVRQGYGEAMLPGIREYAKKEDGPT